MVNVLASISHVMESALGQMSLTVQAFAHIHLSTKFVVMIVFPMRRLAIANVLHHLIFVTECVRTRNFNAMVSALMTSTQQQIVMELAPTMKQQPGYVMPNVKTR